MKKAICITLAIIIFLGAVPTSFWASAESDSNFSTTPMVAVGGGPNSDFSILLKADNTLWTWGYNGYGQLGDGTTSYHLVPAQLSGLGKIKSIAAGYYHTIALKADGTVWTWGYNYHGQLGIGNTENSSIPVKVNGLDHVTAVAAGGYHTVALKADGTLWEWGYNDYGQLGDGTTNNHVTPVQVTSIDNITAVAAGVCHTVALKADGSLWSWGQNNRGQLGDGTTTDHGIPAQASNINNVAAIAAQEYHTVALKSDGTVWGWGYNKYGPLGDRTVLNYLTPVQMNSLNDVIALSTGNRFTVALRVDGTVWAWGESTLLGYGNYSGFPLYDVIPKQVIDLSGVTAIAAGASHTIVLKDEGTVWGWGERNVGDGTFGRRVSPVQVKGDNNVGYINYKDTIYSIVYDAVGASNVPATQTKVPGVPITISDTRPARIGFAFKGWATAPDGAVVYLPGQAYNIDHSNILYAVWNIATYSINYNATGGLVSSPTATKTHGVSLPLQTPTQTGYMFNGWATTPGGAVAYAPGASYTQNAEITLYAVWTPTYTVAYNANGGSGAPANQTKPHGEILKLSNTVPTRAGYIFNAWATTPDGVATYAPSANYADNANITLYAMWTPTYTVAYNANGGSRAPASQIKPSGETLKLSSAVPTRSGYVFSAWGTTPAGTTTYAPGANYTENSDIVLYALWTPTYSVTYNANGGSNAPASQAKIYGESLKLSTAKPIRTGYTFKGWSTNSCNDIAYAPGSYYTQNTQVVLYAVWARSCTTCNGNGTLSAQCTACKGIGQVAKYITCTGCKGSGKQQTIETITTTCAICHGTKYSFSDSLNKLIPCPFCYATGKVQIDKVVEKICSSCAGVGTKLSKVKCSPCSGSGWEYYNKTCSNCQGSGEVSGASNHDSGKWFTVTQATTTKDGKRELRCTRCQAVIKSEVLPKNPNIKLSKTAVTLGVKESFAPVVTLDAPIMVTWSSADKTIATVDTAGKITTAKAGTVVITAKTAMGKTASCTVTVKPAPTSITLNKSAITLGVKETFAVTATLAPSGAASYKRTWSSGNKAVALVDTNGKITALKAGTATITLTLFNGVKKSMTVTVKAAPTSITLNKTAVTLGVKETFAATATLAPSGAASYKRTWSSSNKAVAIVDTNGKITALKAGTATITLTLYNGVKKSMTVTVKAAPTSITLNKTAVTLGVKETFTATATLAPSGAASYKHVWSSSNKAVATVDANGKITALKAGTATITLTLYNGVKKSISVTVKPAPTSVKLTPNPLTMTKGTTKTLAVTLNSGAASYARKFSSSNTAVVKVDAKTGKLTAVKAGTATITVKVCNGKTATCKVTVK